MIDGHALRAEAAKHISRSKAYRTGGMLLRANAERDLAVHLVKAAAIMEALAA